MWHGRRKRDMRPVPHSLPSSPTSRRGVEPRVSRGKDREGKGMDPATITLTLGSIFPVLSVRVREWLVDSH